jgi:hypothetical protein
MLAINARRSSYFAMAKLFPGVQIKFPAANNLPKRLSS